MSVGVGLAITVALLAVNAFFVAGEFAVGVDRMIRLDKLAVMVPASSLTASMKPSPLYSIRKLIALPWAPQPKQW